MTSQNDQPQESDDIHQKFNEKTISNLTYSEII